MRHDGWTGRRWVLFDGESPVGSVQRSGFFRTRTVADFVATIDLTTQVFAVWVVNVIWQQDQSG